jgi:hypothetical protein
VLTSQQLAAIKSELETDPASLGYAAHIAAGNMGLLVELLNATASPDFWVWRTWVTKDEYVASESVDATTFNWTGEGFIGRSQGERDAWRELFSSSGRGAAGVNPSLPNVRQAFTDIFSGATAPAPANRTHMATVSRRKASRFEQVFATGTGSTGSPATMAAEGPVSVDDVITALRS